MVKDELLVTMGTWLSEKCFYV